MIAKKKSLINKGLAFFFFAGFFARMTTFNTLQRTKRSISLSLQLLSNLFSKQFANKNRLFFSGLPNSCLQLCLQKHKLGTTIAIIIDLSSGSGGFRLATL